MSDHLRFLTVDQVARQPRTELLTTLATLSGELARLERLRDAVMARAVELVSRPAPEDDGKLLTAAAAADRLGVTRDWIYTHAAKLPFTRRLDKGTLRFAENGLKRWVLARKVA